MLCDLTCKGYDEISDIQYSKTSTKILVLKTKSRCATNPNLTFRSDGREVPSTAWDM